MSDYRAAAAEALIRHSSYIWNKSRTRIKCQGEDCAAVLDAAGGDSSAIAAFAGHQAEQLPLPPVHARVEQEDVPMPSPVAETPVVTAAQPDTTGQEAEPEPALHDPEPELAAPKTPEPAGEPVEQALSETAVTSTDEKATPKVRRDTKALAAVLAEVQKGDRVSATFNHPYYGIFSIEGTVIQGGIDKDQLIVGGWFINQGEQAAKLLHELAILAPAGKHDFAIPKAAKKPENVGIYS